MLLDDTNTIAVTNGTVIDGAAVTGGSDHAIQTCAFVATPTATNDSPAERTMGTVQTFGGKAQGFNASGAINLTAFPVNTASQAAGSVILLATYDVANAANPGGIGGTEQPCPTPTAVFAKHDADGFAHLPGTHNQVESITPGVSATMQLLDARYFHVTG